MFNSGILDVVIGLTFVFILVSTICSAIREGIESWLKTRATYLEYAIRELLSDRSGQGLAKSFFDHPRIHALFQGDYTSRSSEKPSLFVRGRNLPSYISSKSFAAAIIDLAARGPDKNAQLDSTPLTFDALRANLGKLQNPQVERALVSALDSAQNDLNKVRESLEAWYDDAMDRVSGWYKRSTQSIIFVVAVVVVGGLNINTITIADCLYRNQAVREAAVAAASSQPGEMGYDGALKAFDTLRLPIGWDGGWGSPRSTVERARTGTHAAFEWWNDAIAPVLGLLITAFAATLGAPFWFDVLNKVMVIRATVKPHEKSPEEASEDRQLSPRRAAAQAAAAPPPPPQVIQVMMPASPVPFTDTSSLHAGTHPENDVDGCDVEIEHATPDEALPPATGGVS